MSESLRVGIVGARGIGRHHAKWFAQLGCPVVSLFGTTPASAAAAAEAVSSLIDFQGRVESDWERFIGASDLDAVSICSPPEAHAANAVSALQAGKHVLCEKPLVWDWQAGSSAMLSAARAIVRTADQADRVLAVNAQYPAAVPPLLSLYRAATGREPPLQQVVFRMETAGAPRSSHGPAEVWADLGPHPLALVDGLLPGGEAVLSSARRDASETDALLHLDWRHARRTTTVFLELRRIKEKSAIRREFELDGWTASYQGRNVSGEFRAALLAPPHEWEGEDFMRTSIRQFIEAAKVNDPRRVLLSGGAALRQFETQVALWQRCF
jgi:predicted dehydrogenase